MSYRKSFGLVLSDWSGEDLDWHLEEKGRRENEVMFDTVGQDSSLHCASHFYKDIDEFYKLTVNNMKQFYNKHV